MPVPFIDYISNIDFKQYFDQHLLSKKGGGRDRLSPVKYKQVLLDKEIDEVKKKCLSEEYRFSPYNERLVLKGRGKAPRVLSNPRLPDTVLGDSQEL